MFSSQISNIVLCFDFAELMLLGFISLLLTVFQNLISKFCVPEHVMTNMLPCKRTEEEGNTTTTTEHFQMSFTTSIFGTARRLLAESAETQTGYCARKVGWVTRTLFIYLFCLCLTFDAICSCSKELSWLIILAIVF